jgi:short-subunit dehydrogenase
VNLLGVIATVKAFLPHLVASGDGHVVTVSSVGGIMGQPGLSAYSAAKFGVRGFTETLRSEMLAARHPVQVTVVHPGGVRTPIARRSLLEAEQAGAVPSEAQRDRVRRYEKLLLRMPPEKAARIILDGVERGDPRILVGGDAKVLDLLVRVWPAHYPRVGAWFDTRVFSPSLRRSRRP